MNHVDDLLARLVSGELTDHQRQEMQRHLQGCPRCRDLVMETGHLWERLGVADVPVPDSDLRPRLRARLARRESPAVRLAFRAAVVAVGVLAAWLGSHLEGGPVDPAVASGLSGSLLWEEGALTLDALLVVAETGTGNDAAGGESP